MLAPVVVSILVFLEPLLRPPVSSENRIPSPVSILVFLEPLLRPFSHHSFPFSLARFQSLFFWNHCLDPLPLHIPALSQRVSILVFLEPLLRPNRSD